MSQSPIIQWLQRIWDKQLPDNHEVTSNQGAAGATPWPVENLAQLVPEQYDELVLSYTGENITGVVYKNATVTVATLTLSYTSGKLTGMVRT